MTDKAKLDPESRSEIATVANDITYPGFIGSGVLCQRDDTLLTRGGSLGLRLYDDIERDCHAYGILNKRKLAVIARPWQVEEASAAAADVRAADLVRAQLEAIGVPDPDRSSLALPIGSASDFDVVCYQLLDALLKGYSVGEIMWDTDGSEVVAGEIRPRDPRRFSFDLASQLRLLTPQNPLSGIPVPERKFVVHCWGAKDGSPFGLGLGSRLFWPVFFKRQGITFWLKFLDKFGSPTAVGKYPKGTPVPDQKILLDALGAIAQDSGVTIPEGMIIELLEATRGGTVSYEAACRYMDEQMSFAVLGDAAGGKDSGGALASAAILRNEVRLELVQADSDLLSATLNSTLVPWITQYNVPGARPPKVSRVVKASEDLKALSERDKNLFAIGFKPTLAHVQETYGGEWVERQPPDALPERRGTTANFADPGGFGRSGQEALDAAIRNLPGVSIDSAMQTLLAPAIAALQAGETPDEAGDALLAAFPKLHSSALEELLARAIFVADVWGRLSHADS